MKKLIFLPLFIIFSFGLSLIAQDPEQQLKQEARQHWAFVTDAKAEGNCKEASSRLKWMFDNAPKHSRNLYIRGAQIYNCLAENTDDLALKKIYVDSALLIYDLRIKHYGQQDKVMNYKATIAYKYYIQDPEKFDELWDWFGEALDLNDAATFNSNLLGFTDLIVRYDRQKAPLPLEKVMPIYDQINNIIELKLETGKDLERTRGIQANVDARMEGYFKDNLECPVLTQNFGRRFDQNLDDINFAKTFFRLLRAGDCKSSPYYIRTAKAIFDSEPTFAMAVFIASHLISQKDFVEAEHFYTRALELTEDNTKIADIYLSLGELKKAAGKFIEAREYYRKTVAFDPSSKEKAFTNIGDLYYYSFYQCKQGKSKIQDRAVYFAAYEMYQKAGNQPRMELARSQFPLGSEIHMDTSTRGLGQKVIAGCWINMEVTIRKRDGANN